MRLRTMRATGFAASQAMVPPAGTDGQSRYGAGRKSSLGLGGTVAVHALLIGAFLLIPKEMIPFSPPAPPMTTTNIPIDQPPPPEPTEARTDPKLPSQPQRPTAIDPITPLPTGEAVLTGRSDPGTAIDPGPTIILPPADPPRQPVLTEAAIDPRAMAGFQPDYPGAMIRQGAEGTVTVRVTISPDGRVTDIERIAATDESFWLATQRHALRKWRFRPATRDGVAIGSTKVLTVRFTLTER